MKTIQRIIAILIISTAFFSCTEDDTQIFIADLSSDVIEFQNSFASEYLLSVKYLFRLSLLNMCFIHIIVFRQRIQEFLGR